MVDDLDDHRPTAPNVVNLPCRFQCSVCEGMDHHWLDHCPEDGGEPIQVCKHCPATRPYPDDDEE